MVEKKCIIYCDIAILLFFLSDIAHMIHCISGKRICITIFIHIVTFVGVCITQNVFLHLEKKNVYRPGHLFSTIK